MLSRPVHPRLAVEATDLFDVAGLFSRMGHLGTGLDADEDCLAKALRDRRRREPGGGCSIRVITRFGGSAAHQSSIDFSSSGTRLALTPIELPVWWPRLTCSQSSSGSWLVLIASSSSKTANAPSVIRALMKRFTSAKCLRRLGGVTSMPSRRATARLLRASHGPARSAKARENVQPRAAASLCSR